LSIINPKLADVSAQLFFLDLAEFSKRKIFIYDC
jgi:hypothetical protein